MAIHFYESAVAAQLKNKRKLAAFLKNLIAQYLPEVKKTNINFIFCKDEYLLSINRDFLQHDNFTDIITFDLSESRNKLQAEIYISIDRVHENAQTFQNNYQTELHRVIFHGVLHLCGFKDKTSLQKTEMRRQEDDCLEAYNISS